jgi:hypothetical protein
MFGIFRTTLEKNTIQLFSEEFKLIGFPAKEATTRAIALVDEVKNELKTRKYDISFTHQGDNYSNNEAFASPRIAAGLTTEDIKKFWNRPLLVVFCDLELQKKLMIHEAEKAAADGRDYKSAINAWARNSVRYGTPTHDHSSGALETANRPQDTMIYPEFSMRVNEWFRKTSPEERSCLQSEYGTMNAVIRAMISNKEI